MKGIVTLARLQPVERALVWRVVFLVAAVRIALWVVPFQRLRRFIATIENLPFSVPADMPVSRLVWAVQAASRRIPAASCLTQSIALQCLMTHAGRSSQIHIGVTKDQEKGFQAHAWVEYEGAILLSDAAEANRYVKLLVVEGERA
jgi:hypothetical protein